MSISERLQHLVNALGDNPRSFALDRLGMVSHQTFYNWYKGKFEPKRTGLELIERSIPNLNPNWLRYGQGEMFIKESGTQEFTDTSEYPTLPPTSEVSELKAEVNRLREELKRKSDEVQELRKMFNEKDAIMNETLLKFLRSK